MGGGGAPKPKPQPQAPAQQKLETVQDDSRERMVKKKKKQYNLEDTLSVFNNDNTKQDLS